jgi:hypothetical protein
MLQCGGCNRIIMDSTSEGGWKLRTRMVLFDEEGQAKAICPTCKTQVDVPIMLGAVNALPKPKLVINS